MKPRLGQISTEMLMIIGLMLLLLVPLLFYAYNRTNIAKEDISVQKAEFAAERLARLSDSIGYMGGASAIVDEIEIPPNVRSVSIQGAGTLGRGHDIVFDMDSSTGTKQIVKSSSFVITSSGLEKITRSGGTYWVEISALPLDDPSGAQVRMELK